MVCIGGAAAAAIELGPAVAAFLSGVGIAQLKLLLLFLVRYTLPNVAHAVGFVPDKLMTGEQLSPGRYSEIFRTGAAAGNSFINTRAAG